MSDIKHYNAIFDYLSAPDLPDSAEPVVVFGRSDPLVAQAAGDLIIANFAEVVAISGGIGKDSGDILSRGFRSEAHFVETELLADSARRGYELPITILDEKASNGRENAEHSVKELVGAGYDISSMTANAHATSQKRLTETLKFIAEQEAGQPVVVHRNPSNYKFDPSNPADQDEAAQELLRLVEWPQQGFLYPQSDLPEDLVDFVTEVHGNAPKPVKPWQSALLRKMPKQIQQRTINFAAKHGRK